MAAGLNMVPEAVGKFGRIDAGEDLNLGPKGLVAPWKVNVIVALPVSPGWGGGGYISFEFLEGPLAGQGMYCAEGIKLKVGVGEHSAGTVLGVGMVNPINNAPNNVEIGFVAPGGFQTLAHFLGGQTDQDEITITCGAAAERVIVALGGPSAPNLSGLTPNWSLLPAKLRDGLAALGHIHSQPAGQHASGVAHAQIIIDYDKPVGQRLSVQGTHGSWVAGTEQGLELMQVAFDKHGGWRSMAIPNTTKPLGD